MRNKLKKISLLALSFCMLFSFMTMSASAIQVDSGGHSSKTINGVTITGGEYLYQYDEATGQLVLELSSRPVLYDLYTEVNITYTYTEKYLIFFEKTKTATDSDTNGINDYPSTYRVFETAIVGSNTVENPSLQSLTGIGTASYYAGNGIFYIWGGEELSN